MTALEAQAQLIESKMNNSCCFLPLPCGCRLRIYSSGNGYIERGAVLGTGCPDHRFDWRTPDEIQELLEAFI